jgi:hypothetical protein
MRSSTTGNGRWTRHKNVKSMFSFTQYLFTLTLNSLLFGSDIPEQRRFVNSCDTAELRDRYSSLCSPQGK